MCSSDLHFLQCIRAGAALDDFITRLPEHARLGVARLGRVVAVDYEYPTVDHCTPLDARIARVRSELRSLF